MVFETVVHEIQRIAGSENGAYFVYAPLAPTKFPLPEQPSSFHQRQDGHATCEHRRKIWLGNGAWISGVAQGAS